jgi:hypothetical protein
MALIPRSVAHRTSSIDFLVIAVFVIFVLKIGCKITIKVCLCQRKPYCFKRMVAFQGFTWA